MSHVSKSLEVVTGALTIINLRELARRANVPYTTLRGWQALGFKPSAIELLVRLEEAASVVMAETSQIEANATTDKSAVKVGHPVGELAQ